jgi:hypothetical protein
METFINNHKTEVFKLVFIGLILLFLTIPAYCTTKTWVGQFLGLGNGNWNTAGNWSPSGVPAATDDLVFNELVLGYTVSLSGSAVASTITINGAVGLLGGVTINTEGYALTVSNGLNVGAVSILLPVTLNILGSGAVSLNTAVVIYADGTLNLGSGSDNSTNVIVSGTTITNNNYATLNNYGTLTANSSAIFNLSGSSSEITNSGNFYAGTSGSACALNLSGTSSSINNTGIFVVGSTSVINLTGTTTSVANSGTFTLMSDQNGSATTGQISSGATGFSGQYNVQRYLTGQTSSTYRGYRLLSSPVNLTSATASATGANYIGLSTINSTYTVAGTKYYGAFTAGSGSGFSVYNANPIIYFYNETVATNNSSFLLGKNLGVTAISAAASNNITLVNGTTYSMPVGNGYILYYVGSTNGRSSGCKCLAPDNATITNVGYLNQGTIPLNLWYAPGGSTLNSLKLSYTSGQPVTFYPGYNMVGNPYPSTIDLNVVYTDNQTASFSSNFYELYNENPNQGYVVYSATGGTSSFHASEYIASGQGFFTVVTATNQTLTFKEDQKVYNNLLTPSSNPPLLLTAPQGALSKPNVLALQGTPVNVLAGLHLKMGLDSVINEECGIYFGPWSDNYDINDAYALGGVAPQVSLSSFTADGVPAAINKFADYVPNGKRIKLYVKAVADGNYNLSLEDIANIDTSLFNIYLVDNINRDSLDLVRYKTYVFTITNADTNSYGANRLVLAIDRKTMPAYALVSFTSQKTGDGVLLTWKTYNEGDYTGFGIQKQDGTQYETLYNVQSNGAGIYTYTDRSPAAGKNTYRLLQNNMDSLTSYSNPVSILYNAASAIGMLSIYPNPARGTINVNMNIAATATVSYQEAIYNSSGKLVVQRAVNNTSWAQDVSALTPGAYVIQIKTGNGSSVSNSKFVKMQ